MEELNYSVPKIQEDSVHDSLAMAITNEILSDLDTVDVRLYCRSLSTLQLTSTNRVRTYVVNLVIVVHCMCVGGKGVNG